MTGISRRTSWWCTARVYFLLNQYELVSWMSVSIIDISYPKSISHSNNLDQVSKQAGSSRKSLKKDNSMIFFTIYGKDVTTLWFGIWFALRVTYSHLDIHEASLNDFSWTITHKHVCVDVKVDFCCPWWWPSQLGHPQNYFFGFVMRI